MEHVTCDLNNVHATTHTKAYNWMNGLQPSGTRRLADVSQFHVYAMEWTEARIQVFYDDVLVFEYENEGTGSASWPFSERFHLLLNIAGGFFLNIFVSRDWVAHVDVH
jgi:beta-glucanase (GH16 family)